MTKEAKSSDFIWRNVPVERAAEVMREEHGGDALRQVRLGKAAGKHARNRKIYGYWEAVERLLLEGAAKEKTPPSDGAGCEKEGLQIASHRPNDNELGSA